MRRADIPKSRGRRRVAPMPDGVTLTLPMPPSVNGYWRCFRNRAIISRRGRQFRTAAMAAIAEQGSPKFGDARLEVTINLHPATRRKFDADNFSKGILDSLSHAGVWDDDEQVDIIHVHKKAIRKGGESIVFIAEIE